MSEPRRSNRLKRSNQHLQEEREENDLTLSAQEEGTNKDAEAVEASRPFDPNDEDTWFTEEEGGCMEGVCEVCSESGLGRRRNVVAHQKSAHVPQPVLDGPHAGKLRFHCQDCHDTFGDLKVLTRHARRTHKGWNSIFTCRDCGHQSNDRTIIYRHCRRHHRRDFCLRCGREFYDLAKLERHQLQCTDPPLGVARRTVRTPSPAKIKAWQERHRSDRSRSPLNAPGPSRQTAEAGGVAEDEVEDAVIETRSSRKSKRPDTYQEVDSEEAMFQSSGSEYQPEDDANVARFFALNESNLGSSEGSSPEPETSARISAVPETAVPETVVPTPDAAAPKSSPPRRKKGQPRREYEAVLAKYNATSAGPSMSSTGEDREREVGDAAAEDVGDDGERDGDVVGGVEVEEGVGAGQDDEEDADGISPSKFQQLTAMMGILCAENFRIREEVNALKAAVEVKAADQGRVGRDEESEMGEGEGQTGSVSPGEGSQSSTPPLPVSPSRPPRGRAAEEDRPTVSPFVTAPRVSINAREVSFKHRASGTEVRPTNTTLEARAVALAVSRCARDTLEDVLAEQLRAQPGLVGGSFSLDLSFDVDVVVGQGEGGAHEEGRSGVHGDDDDEASCRGGE